MSESEQRSLQSLPQPASNCVPEVPCTNSPKWTSRRVSAEAQRAVSLRWESVNKVNEISDITEMLAREDADTEELIGGAGRQQSRGKAPVPGLSSRDAGRHATDLAGMPAADLAELIQQLTDLMHTAARELQFELAARYRDEIGELKKELRGMRAAGAS